jgi:hypothetical protein
MKNARQWFVGFKQLDSSGPLASLQVHLIGPVYLSEVPKVLHICFEDIGFDGLYEWDGVPDAEQISKVVKSGNAIASMSQALRLIVPPKFANSPGVTPMDPEMIRDTIGLAKAEEN